MQKMQVPYVFPKVHPRQFADEFGQTSVAQVYGTDEGTSLTGMEDLPS
jgi:hypothetical protein